MREAIVAAFDKTHESIVSAERGIECGTTGARPASASCVLTSSLGADVIAVGNSARCLHSRTGTRSRRAVSLRFVARLLDIRCDA